MSTVGNINFCGNANIFAGCSLQYWECQRGYIVSSRTESWLILDYTNDIKIVNNHRE